MARWSRSCLLGVFVCLTSGVASAEPPGTPAIREVVRETDTKPLAAQTSELRGATVTTSQGTVIERQADQVQGSGASGGTRTYAYKLLRGRMEVNITSEGRNKTAVLVTATSAGVKLVEAVISRLLLRRTQAWRRR